MVEEKYRDLMNREIDGVTTPEESSRLNKVLSQDAEAQMLFDELKHLTQKLSNTRSVDPPRYLRAHIMNSLPAKLYAKQRKPSFFASLVTFRFPTVRLAYVVTLFVGVIVGISGIIVFSDQITNNAQNLSYVVGSTITQSSVANLKVADQAHIVVPHATLDVNVKYSPDVVLVGIDGASSKNIDIQVEFSHNQLTFESFHQFDGTGNGFIAGVDNVNLVFHGDSHVGLLLRQHGQASAPIKVKIYDQGQIVADRILATSDGIKE